MDCAVWLKKAAMALQMWMVKMCIFVGSCVTVRVLYTDEEYNTQKKIMYFAFIHLQHLVDSYQIKAYNCELNIQS